MQNIRSGNFKNYILAISLGCIVMFMWGGLSHMVIFTGTGFSQLPNEDKVIEALGTSIDKQGLYFFPGKDFKNTSSEKDAAWEKKFRTGPAGLIIYRPVGGNPFSPTKLIWQLISTLICALLATFITSFVFASYWKRVLVIALLGIIACAAVGSIYWNWYEFPTSFFLAQILDQLIGFFLGGLVIARFVPLPSIPKVSN